MIVLCHGCWDILHIGHVRHLLEAKTRFGDVLIVSVSEDSDVARKGPDRPFYRLDERMEVLQALRFVDHVIPAYGNSAAQNIRQVRPDVYCKGVDYRERGIAQVELDACKLVGASVRFTESDKRSVTEEVLRKCVSV